MYGRNAARVAFASSSDVSCWVDAFASALDRDPAADLGDFLPPRDDVLYLAALGELVRMSLAHSRGARQPRPLTEPPLRVS